MKAILLVEDNEDDIFLVKLACDRSGFPHTLKTARDGQEAIDYLSGKGHYSDRSKYPLPDLVLLDIYMPRLNGHEVLSWIRTHPQLAELPVVMLTASQDEDDAQHAYRLGVTSYLPKGEDLVEFGQGMRVILKYWSNATMVAA